MQFEHGGYTINQIARMLGITPKTLRYYENLGLIKPHRKEETNYRIYTDEDIDRVRQILFYRKLEFPLKDIAKLLNCAEPKQGAIRTQIEYLEKTSMRYDSLASLARSVLPGILSDGKVSINDAIQGGTALIIQSMQNDFVTGPIACRDAEKIIPNIARLADAARNNEIPVIYVNDMHILGVDSELALWGDHALVGTPGFETISELYPRQGEKVIYKRFYGGFLRTDLQKVLKELGVTDIIVTGVLTDVGISHTVADGFYRGYRMLVPEDCTAAVYESQCTYALKEMKTNFGIKTTGSEDLAREFEMRRKQGQK